MKPIFFFLIAAATFSETKCNKEKIAGNCYKGRLEVKGMCSNYTIAVLEGTIDPAKIEASWTDENTNKTYKNVFALGSPCSFPENISEGQEFYFSLDAPAQDCMVCQAFYPKPSKSLSIKVLDKPCR
jgi:hypothetical protein